MGKGTKASLTLCTEFKCCTKAIGNYIDSDWKWSYSLPTSSQTIAVIIIKLINKKEVFVGCFLNKTFMSCIHDK